ncbi:chaperone-usher fimbrial major subunit [Pseudocitrobacter vendiensis]|uniref:Fimbrial protein n=1 Tax=Pseudocitrobacter vendiensis TaxID=2488306 RepID=A0ABN8T9T4_9ENTR|nr:chaperone-usher fimbrial major subunit [Pseudocitrobacter vendiensis]CAH6636146.1 Fimbrial protein [Pseudocitrobacter vendiensis]
MKRNIIGGALTLASLMLAGNALAEDGVVHFVGEIVDSTCEVTSDTADQTVPLGKVSKSAFVAVGSVASPQEFSIKLEKCPATYTQAAVRFDGTEDPAGNGDLKVGTPMTSGNPGDYPGTGAAIAATGVAIRIFNREDNSQVKLYNDSAYTPIAADGTAEMKFIARYVATSATVTAGTANADSQFTVEYKK